MPSQSRQPTSLQPNTQSKELPKEPNTSSPAALLWAHQLHREQNALSSQLLKLESSLITSITASNESTLLKIDALTAQLDSLRSEVEQLRCERALEAEKTVRSWDDKWNDKFDGVGDRLRAGFERDYEMTSEMVRRELGKFKDEIIDTVKKSKSAESKHQAPDIPRPGHKVPSPAPRDFSSRRIAQATPTASSLPRHIETQPAVVWQNSICSMSTHCRTPIEQNSVPHITRPTDAETREHVNLPKQTIPMDKQLASPELIMQGPIPLSKFLDLGPTYISQGHGESQIAKALWKGLNDLELRRLVAKELPYNTDQWTCSEFSNIVRKLETQKGGLDRDAEKAKVKTANGKRRKRRRVISVVWPAENEEED
ncbi:hypothetical protein FQN49_006346 [Arthroderma sp. PD_2]|nr:hypothetical protein FQN49_006346 [Arthroderma sp. PD_2]